jgi:hypothetical protein
MHQTKRLDLFSMEAEYFKSQYINIVVLPRFLKHKTPSRFRLEVLTKSSACGMDAEAQHRIRIAPCQNVTWSA